MPPARLGRGRTAWVRSRRGLYGSSFPPWPVVPLRLSLSLLGPAYVVGCDVGHSVSRVEVPIDDQRRMRPGTKWTAHIRTKIALGETIVPFKATAGNSGLTSGPSPARRRHLPQAPGARRPGRRRIRRDAVVPPLRPRRLFATGPSRRCGMPVGGSPRRRPVWPTAQRSRRRPPNVGQACRPASAGGRGRKEVPMDTFLVRTDPRLARRTPTPCSACASRSRTRPSSPKA